MSCKGSMRSIKSYANSQGSALGVCQEDFRIENLKYEQLLAPCCGGYLSSTSAVRVV